MAKQFEIGDKVKVLIDGEDWGMPIGLIGKVVGYLGRDDLQTIEFQGLVGKIYIGYRPDELEYVEPELELEFMFVLHVYGHGANRAEAWKNAQDAMKPEGVPMYEDAIEVE